MYVWEWDEFLLKHGHLSCRYQLEMRETCQWAFPACALRGHLFCLCSIKYSPCPHFLTSIIRIHLVSSLAYILFCVYMILCLTCHNAYWNNFTVERNFVTITSPLLLLLNLSVSDTGRLCCWIYFFADISAIQEVLSIILISAGHK